MRESTLVNVNKVLIADEVSRGRSVGEIVDQLMQAVLETVPDVAPLDLTVPAQVGRRVLLSECVSAKDAAKLYSIERDVDAEAVKKAARAGKIIAAKGTGGELRFPTWQFAEDGGVLPGIKEALAELRQSPAWGDMLPFTFMLNHHPLLEGKRPIDVLRTGSGEAVNAVQKAAQSARY